MSRKNWLNLFNYLSFAIFLIIFSRKAGEEAMGILLISLMSYFFVFVIMMGSVKNTLSKMVAARIKRGFTENSKKIFSYTLIYTFICSIIMLLMFVFLSNSVTYSIFGSNTAGFVLAFFGVLFVINSFYECIKGYYLGHGGNLIIVITDVLRNILLIGLSPLGVKIFQGYGEKVASLKKNTIFISTYSSIGAVGVICVANLVGLIILVVGLYTVMRKDSYSFNEVRTRDGYRAFLRNFIPVSLKELQYNIFPIVLLVIYSAVYMKTGIKKSITDSELYIGLGNIYVPFCVTSLALMSFREFANGQKTRLKIDFRKEDRKALLQRFNAFIKNSLTILIPLLLLILIGASAIATGVFKASLDVTKSMVVMAAFCIILAGIDMVFDSGLDATNMSLLGLLGNIAGLVVGLILLLASSKNGLSINMVTLALILNYLVRVIIHGIFSIRNIGAKGNDILAKVIKVAIACFIMAIVELILVKFIAMNIFTFILTVIICLVIYTVILVLLQGINQKELNYMYGSLLYYPLNFAALLFHVQ